jgi:predicted acetyltransferase
MLPDRPAVEALYERVAGQGHFALARSPEWWEKRLWTYPGDWVVYEGKRRGQIEGYLYYEVDTTNGPFKLALTLSEFVAATPAAHRALVGHLATLADQVQEIQFAAPADGAWLEQLRSAENLHPAAEISLFADNRRHRERAHAAGHGREARARGLSGGASDARRDRARRG